MTFGLADKDRAKICDVFKKFPDIEQALIFGSRALGSFKAGSDIDLALKGTLRPQTLSRVKSELEEESTLPYFFDIVAYNDVENPAFKSHIDGCGRVFYQRDAL